MSYSGISVKDAINKINSNNNGWFLPAVQRPYVWGSRYESEAYICKLFDSILNEYPIGGLILWNTSDKIPYREFMKDYTITETSRIVDEGLHGRPDKWLVYDGQQRLQTLFSCLRYTFNKRVLTFDLLFQPNVSDSETGFSFVEKNEELPWYKIKMNELFSRLPDSKVEYRKAIFSRSKVKLSTEEELIAETSLDKVWPTFAESGKLTLAYFQIKEQSEDKVNEIFERLNTGGMALSLADLLLSKIKAKYYDFEERLQDGSKVIAQVTEHGFEFNAYSLLQLIFLIIKGSIRVDPKKVDDSEIEFFEQTWRDLEVPLKSFFSNYLWGQFKINRNAIVPRQQAILPIIIYFFEIYRKGFSFKKISDTNLVKINTYFIKSQINDWNLQSYIDNFTRIIQNSSSSSTTIFDFPLEAIEMFVKDKGNRFTDLKENTFVGYTWFALKVLMPDRIFQFNSDIGGRFNPEIDHIFPVNLSIQSANYVDFVDTIWNKQPTKGEINLLKSNIHPRFFFTDSSKNKKGEIITGSKYVSDYDFLPKDSNQIANFNDLAWDDVSSFVEFRRNKMIAYFEGKYSLVLEK